MRKLIDSHGGLLRLLTSLPSWTGATWAIDGNGRAYNTPTLGSELLTDGGLENWSSATNLTSWSEGVAGTSTVNQEASIVRGGTYAARLDVDGALSNVQIAQSIAATAGGWYVFSVYSRGSDAGIQARITPSGTQGTLINQVLTTSFALMRTIGRATTTTIDIILSRSTGAASKSIYFDDASISLASLSTLPATVVGTAGQTVTAKPYAISAGTQAGVISHLDSTSSPANFIIAYHDGGTSIKMDKCVGGTYTNLVTATVSFVSDAAIEIRPLGSNQFDCYYNGSKQGNTATVSDAGIISNTRHGLFSTYSGNTFSEFTLGGAVVALALPGA